jgi:hypothetical protein
MNIHVQNGCPYSRSIMYKKKPRASPSCRLHIEVFLSSNMQILIAKKKGGRGQDLCVCPTPAGEPLPLGGAGCNMYIGWGGEQVRVFTFTFIHSYTNFNTSINRHKRSFDPETEH